MNNKKFVGFFIVGTKTEEDAKEGKGLILWMQEKPSWLKIFYNKLFLGIRWVNKEDYTPPVVPTAAEDATFKVVMPKQRSYKKKTTNGADQERRNPVISASSNK